MNQEEFDELVKGTTPKEVYEWLHTRPESETYVLGDPSNDPIAKYFQDKVRLGVRIDSLGHISCRSIGKEFVSRLSPELLPLMKEYDSRFVIHKERRIDRNHAIAYAQVFIPIKERVDEQDD